MSTRVRPDILIAWTRPPLMPSAVRFALFVFSIHLLTLLPVELLGLSVVQAITGFLILSFVPGIIVVSYALDELTLTNILYAIGFSVAFSMVVGSLANLLYLRLPIDLIPFTQPTMSLIYVGGSSVLSGIVWIASEPDSELSIYDKIPNYDVRVVLLLACIPIFAITGALFINRYATNDLTLFTIAYIAFVPVFVYHFDESGKYYSAAITVMSSALLLQNTVITTHLTRGDALGEYSSASAVLHNGFWIPSGSWGSMPRIVTLQPAYSLLMDIDLFWVFKLIHPILYVAVPLLTYLISIRYFSKDIAFFSGVLYIFLPRTYQIISRNTRTGAAIFFTAFLLLAILDSDLPSRTKRMFILVFCIGMMMSHYGISTLVVFCVVVAYILNVLSEYVLNNKYKSKIWFTSILLFISLYFVWYGYMTDGLFSFLMKSTYNQVSSALFFTGESTAVRSVTVSESRGIFGMPPGSYEIMFVGHLLLGIFTSIGISLLYVRYLFHGFSHVPRVLDWLEQNVLSGLSDRVVEDSNYVHLAIGLFLLFPLSFGPQILSAGRTYALVLVIVAPIPILVLRSTRFKQIGSKPILACLVVFLLFSSGFVSAAVTHDVSPQPIIDGDRIVEEGSTVEQFALYRAFTPENSIESSHFMLSHLPDDAVIQRSRLSAFSDSFYDDQEATNLRFTQLEGSENDLQGYRYLSEPDTVTGTITQRHAGFIFYEYEPLPSFPNSNTIYSSGQDEIHHGHHE